MAGPWPVGDIEAVEHIPREGARAGRVCALAGGRAWRIFPTHVIQRTLILVS